MGIYQATQGTQPILYNNCKCNVTFKIVNHYIVQHKLYNIVQQLYFTKRI